MGQETVRNGVFSATDRRLVFYAKKMSGCDLESFPYQHLSSFEGGKSMMGHHVRFFVSGNEVKVKWMKSDIADLLTIVKGKMHAASTPAPAPAAPHSPRRGADR